MGYDVALNLPFDLPNESNIVALRRERGEERAKILTARGLESFKGFDKTHTNDILAVVERGVSEGKQISDIRRDLENFHKNMTPSKARTIAQTEVLTAASMGQAAMAEDAAELIPGLRKRWITAGDSRVRDHHKDLDGTSVDIGEKWSNDEGSLRYPRDVFASAKNRINCRCSWMVVPPNENLRGSGEAFTGIDQ